MATTTGQDKGTSGSRSADGPDQGGVAQTARHVAGTVAGAAAGAAGEVGSRLPEVASGTRDAFSEANRMVRSGSDQTLLVAGSFSIGLALGLLLGGANRLLVVLSLIPAGLIGTTLVERMDSSSGSADR
jgi:hypothetical protein